MSESKKPTSSIRFTPLKTGQSFDIVPPKKPTQKPSAKTPAAKKQASSRDGFRFALVGLLVVVILSGLSVVGQGRQWVNRHQPLAFASLNQLQQGMGDLANYDLEGAENWFIEAEKTLQQLAQNTDTLTRQANQFLDQNLYLDTADTLIQGGVIVSQIGQTAPALIQSAETLKKALISDDPNRMQKWNTAKRHLNQLTTQLSDLNGVLSSINLRILPEEMAAQVHTGQQTTKMLLTTAQRWKSYFEAGSRFLGDEMPHHILILLQNKHERRATGGFIGSVVLITLNDGKITAFEPQDVYKIDGQLTESIETPPGIDRVATNWHLRDANYSPDFPTSAEQIRWFLEHSRGPSVDTVIAIDQTVAEKLLELTGPLVVGDIPVEINSETFTDVVSFYTEAKLAGAENPKAILFEVMTAIRQKMESISDWNALLKMALNLTEGRHVQLYSEDPYIQGFAQNFELDGRLIAPANDTDFLAVISTSIGGNKSDRFIQTTLNHRTDITEKGQLNNQLKITKQHTWNEAAWGKWRALTALKGTGQLSTETMRFIMGEGENRDFMRVYVPKGSRLTDSRGVDPESILVYEDLGHTVFAFEVLVAAGQRHTVSLDYTLPFTLALNPASDYRLIAQKQAGAQNVTLSKEVVTSQGISIVKQHPQQESPFALGARYEFPLDRDRVMATALKK